MAEMARVKGANWVINSDVDEFWVAANRKSLRQWFRQQKLFNVISAQRHDFLCVEGDHTPFWQRMVYRKMYSTNPLGKPLPPKVAHRAAHGLTVANGNHSVSGFRWQRRKSLGLEVLHFPLRSKEQYTRKIELGCQALANNTKLSQSQYSTWRQQYTELQTTGQLAYVKENIVSPRALKQMLADGTVVEDRRLTEFFESEGIASPLPD
jgi:hypothetical protein